MSNICNYVYPIVKWSSQSLKGNSLTPDDTALVIQSVRKQRRFKSLIEYVELIRVSDPFLISMRCAANNKTLTLKAYLVRGKQGDSHMAREETVVEKCRPFFETKEATRALYSYLVTHFGYNRPGDTPGVTTRGQSKGRLNGAQRKTPGKRQPQRQLNTKNKKKKDARSGSVSSSSLSGTISHNVMTRSQRCDVPKMDSTDVSEETFDESSLGEEGALSRSGLEVSSEEESTVPRKQYRFIPSPVIPYASDASCVSEGEFSGLTQVW